MNTSATHSRFWKAMTERYGSRWAENYGLQPTQSWKALLDQYTPNNLADALVLLQRRTDLHQHPPTLPQFETLLANAVKGARAELTTADYRRGYWRSVIAFGLSDQLGYRWTDHERFLSAVIADKSGIGRAMGELLNELDELEIRTGQRTPGIEDRASQGIAAIARAYSSLAVPRSETASYGGGGQDQSPDTEPQAPF